MKSQSKTILSLGVIVFILMFIGSKSAHAAWQEPPAGCETPDSPTYDDASCNITPPINTSAAAQTKLGTLTTGGFTSTNGLRIQGGVVDFTGTSGVTLGIGAVDSAEIQNATILWEDLDQTVKDQIPTIGNLDARYVNIPGDSMTGRLEFQAVNGANVPTPGVITINQPPSGKNAISVLESGSNAAGVLIRLANAANQFGLHVAQSSGNTTIARFEAIGGSALQASSTGANPTISVNATGTGGGVVAITSSSAVYTGTTQIGSVFVGTTASGAGLDVQNTTSAPSHVVLSGPRGAGVFQNNIVIFETPANTTTIQGANITLQGTGGNITIQSGNMTIQDGQLSVATSSPINPAVDVTGNVDVNGDLTAALIESTDHFRGNGIEVRNIESIHNDANDAQGAPRSAHIPEIRTAVITLQRLNPGIQTIIPLAEFGIPHDGYTVIPVGIEVLKCPGCNIGNGEDEIWSEYDPFLGEEAYLRYTRCQGNTFRNTISLTNQLQEFAMFSIMFTYYSVSSDNPANPCGYQNFNFDL